MLERLILARHTETTYNARRLANGDPSVDVHLTERGREQARRLGASLADVAIDLCVTTEYPRTQETARIALAGRDVPMTVLPELNDPPAGDFEGRSVDELAVWFGEAGPDAVMPGTTVSHRDALVRFVTAAEWLAGRPEHTIFVIAHAMSTGWLAHTARGHVGPFLPITQGEPIEVTGAGLRAALPVVRRDPLAYWLLDA